MADDPRYRTFIETPEYTAQLDFLAEKHSIDELENALLGIMWGMATNPQVYEPVTGNIRTAKSRSRDTIHPSFQVFFQIMSDNAVLLLWIEEIGSIDSLSDK